MAMATTATTMTSGAGPRAARSGPPSPDLATPAAATATTMTVTAMTLMAMAETTTASGAASTVAARSRRCGPGDGQIWAAVAGSGHPGGGDGDDNDGDGDDTDGDGGDDDGERRGFDGGSQIPTVWPRGRPDLGRRRWIWPSSSLLKSLPRRRATSGNSVAVASDGDGSLDDSQRVALHFLPGNLLTFLRQDKPMSSSIQMANGMGQDELALAPTKNTTAPRTSNHVSGYSNCHGDKGNNGMVACNSRQDSVDNSSSRISEEDNIEDNFKLLWRLRKYLILLGTLAVSVTYNAGLTPPGGFWTLTKDNHEAGNPILPVGFSERYEVFFYCNATAFAASLVLIILLLSKSVTRHKWWLRSMQFTMILDLFSLMGAYAAGSCRALKSSIYVWILVFAVFTYVGIHVLVFIRVIPGYLKEMVQKMLIQIPSKWCGHDSPQMGRHQDKDVEDARKFILILVTFAATVTYQAGLSPPGGFWAENEYDPDRKLPPTFPPYKHRPATSVLRSNYLHRYKIFVSCNSTSFVASLVTVMLLLSPELSKHGIRSKAVILCVVADLLCLIGAYAAGCCRDVATSFYVMFITIIVLFFFVLLVGIFLYKPVAVWLDKFKSGSIQCMGNLGRMLSFSFRSNRLSNAEQENSVADHHISVTVTGSPSEDNASETEHHPADNQGIYNTNEGLLHEEHLSRDNKQTADTEETKSGTQHPSGNSKQSANTMVAVSNRKYQSTDCQMISSTEEVVPNIEHSSAVSYQQTANTKNDMSAENQQVASRKEQTSTDDFKMPVEDLSEKNMLVRHCNEDSDETTVSEIHSIPVEASGHVECAEQHVSVQDQNHNIEILGINNGSEPIGNGHIHNKQEASIQNANSNQIEEHMNKTRTNLLLLAILAVSLTYQSGLNPPGGFWSTNEYSHADGDHIQEYHHSPGDRILEDIYHSRFIAFFYLNAVAFVASVVMIILLLNKMMTMKVTKRRALQIVMIVNLLSLTGAFVMGSCREANKSICISVLVFLVLAYVLVHVLIAIHVIPQDWRRYIPEKLKNFLCRPVLDSSSELLQNWTEDIKELGRRRNLLLTLSILAATVTYQAGMNPPGGVWSDDKDVSGLPGNPILQDTHPKRYGVFYYSNSLSFVSSVVTTILLVNKESCDHGIKSYALRVCLVVGLVALLIAYAAGSCRKAMQSIYLIIIAVAVFISIAIQVLLLSSTHNTLQGPLGQSLQRSLRFLLNENSSGPQETTDPEEKKERKRKKYLMLLAVLAASIAYQAGLNPPGGFWSDDSGHKAGDPILHDVDHIRRRYKTFFCFNAFSFMSSIVVIMLLLSKSVREKDLPLDVLYLIMLLDLLSLMTAFAAGSCRKFRTSVYVYGLVIGVVIYLLLVTVLSSGIAKYLRSRRRSVISSQDHPGHVSRENTPSVGHHI
uniref:PGG domain-containing protein n=1 Tax=Leersia perrieri TaxID=77586 RepID=A0A0D9WPE9_9ORYZ